MPHLVSQGVNRQLKKHIAWHVPKRRRGKRICVQPCSNVVCRCCDRQPDTANCVFTKGVWQGVWQGAWSRCMLKGRSQGTGSRDGCVTSHTGESLSSFEQVKLHHSQVLLSVVQGAAQSLPCDDSRRCAFDRTSLMSASSFFSVGATASVLSSAFFSLAFRSCSIRSAIGYSNTLYTMRITRKCPFEQRSSPEWIFQTGPSESSCERWIGVAMHFVASTYCLNTVWAARSNLTTKNHDCTASKTPGSATNKNVPPRLEGDLVALSSAAPDGGGGGGGGGGTGLFPADCGGGGGGGGGDDPCCVSLLASDCAAEVSTTFEWLLFLESCPFIMLPTTVGFACLGGDEYWCALCTPS